ncbi:MAG: hypothetical protein WA140_12540 [Geobacteraceae bacterium]
MKIYGLSFSEETIGDIQRIVDENPAISRRSLLKRLCELFNWHSATGRLKEMNCRKAVSMLHRCNLVCLPEASPVPGFQTKALSKPYIRSAVVCSLAELGCVNLILVDNPRSEQAGIWKSLMAGHYLGARTFYYGLRYLVHSSVDGYLGALSFGSAAFRITFTCKLLKEANVTSRPFSMRRNPSTRTVQESGFMAIRAITAFRPVAASIPSIALLLTMPGRTKAIKLAHRVMQTPIATPRFCQLLMATPSSYAPCLAYNA